MPHPLMPNSDHVQERNRTMTHGQSLSELIEAIYDAALRPDTWPDVLVKIHNFTGGVGAGIYVTNSARKIVSLSCTTGIEARYNQSYVDTYVKLDPTTVAHLLFDAGEVFSTVDVMPYDDFIRTRFYREWVRPQGLVDCANVIREKSETSYSSFCVFRHERNGLVDSEMRQRLLLLAPHVRRAALIGKAIEFNAVEAKVFKDLIDTLSVAVYLIDSSGRVVHENTAGRLMLDTGEILASISGRFMTRNEQANAALACVLEAETVGTKAGGAKSIAVPMSTPDGKHYIAHVLPLTSGQRNLTGVALRAVAAVFVCNAEFNPPSAPELIAKLYNLTPTELRVLLAIVEIGGVPKVAETLGIAETTVRTHLERLFDKTGVCRQADLVKIVAGVTSPLRG